MVCVMFIMPWQLVIYLLAKILRTDCVCVFPSPRKHRSRSRSRSGSPERRRSRSRDRKKKRSRSRDRRRSRSKDKRRSRSRERAGRYRGRRSPQYVWTLTLTWTSQSPSCTMCALSIFALTSIWTSSAEPQHTCQSVSACYSWGSKSWVVSHGYTYSFAVFDVCSLLVFPLSYQLSVLCRNVLSNGSI